MRSVIFAGGGTGGHLYPALAIVEALEGGASRATARSCGANGGDASIRFVCSDRPLDARILSGARVPFTPIAARPLSVRPKALATLAFRWGGAVRTARGVIRAASTDAPPVVVAMGGYVAAPVVQAARAEKAPVLLVNLDAVPGKANAWIARHASRVLSAAPVERDGWVRVPPIVRNSAIGGDPRACREMFGLDPDARTLLVTGASQGARSINLFLAAFVDRHADLLRGWQVLHQCGDKDEDDVRFAYEASSVPAVVTPFIDPMGPAWGAADLALSRAGAGSVGEAWANRVPTIFMPYPHHKDQHQRRNAEVLEDGCAIARDRIMPPTNVAGEAGEALRTLLGDEGARGRMRSALERLGNTDGARRVAREIHDV